MSCKAFLLALVCLALVPAAGQAWPPTTRTARDLLTWPNPEIATGYCGGICTGNLLLSPPFLPNVKVSDDPGAGNQDEPSMAVSKDGTVLIGWNDDRMGAWRLFYSSSSDGGLTWSANGHLTEPTYSNQADPALGSDTLGNLYFNLLSYEYSGSADSYLTKSTDGGQTWGPNVLVSANTSTTNEDREWMTTDGDQNVYCTFTSFSRLWTYSDVRFARSTNGGQSFQPWIKLNDNATSNSFRNSSIPRVGPGGVIYVVWGEDDRYGSKGIFLTKSTDGGVSFGPNQQVIDAIFSTTPPWRLHAFPTFAVDKITGNLYLAWNDDRSGNLDLLFIRSTDGGTTWSIPLKVNDDVVNARQAMPWMDVDPYGNIHLIWYDTRSGGWNLDVYYAKSSDGGQTFSQNLRITDVATAGGSFIGDFIATVADPQKVYATWSDNRNGSQDIYYSATDILPPDLTLTLAPDSTALHRGGQVSFTATLVNNGSLSQTVQGWTEVTLPNGHPYPGNPVIGPTTFTISPHGTLTRSFTHALPSTAPLGTYTYCAKVGTYPSIVITQDCFDFDVLSR